MQVGWEDVDYIYVALNGDQFWVLTNMAVNFLVP